MGIIFDPIDLCATLIASSQSAFGRLVECLPSCAAWVVQKPLEVALETARRAQRRSLQLVEFE